MAALEHLFQNALTGLGLSLQNCPLDVLIFLSMDHAPKACRRMAPASVANCISARSKNFQAFGKGSTSLEGNPAKFPDLKTWLRGYTRESTAATFTTTGAKVCQHCLIH